MHDGDAMARTLKAAVAGNLAEAVQPAEEVTKKTNGDTVEARSVSRTIRTVEDLLSHIEADLTRYEVAASEATKWESAAVDRSTGQWMTVELHRVFVRLRPKVGPRVEELVGAMIAGASGRLRVRDSRTWTKSVKGRPWAVLPGP